jgi:triosephosphate isomerase
VVAAKTQRALEQGLSVIPCIGETLDQRNAGELFGVLEAQVRARSVGLFAVDARQHLCRAAGLRTAPWEGCRIECSLQ